MSDDFEGGPALSPANWAANSHGQIVSDPLNNSNHVLNFTTTWGGGDLFSINVPASAIFYLSFDYLYQSPSPFGGGFVGYNDPSETWLAGDCGGCYGTESSALNNPVADVWNHIQIQFVENGPGPLALKFEQFQGTAGNAYFDNIILSDSGFGGEAPEPSSAVLILAGVAIAAANKLRRR